MTAALKIPDPMSLTEFLAWEAPDAARWQLVDGTPCAVAPASPIHAAVQNELGRLLGNHLAARGGPCRVYSTPGVLPGRKAHNNFRIPDIGVSSTLLIPGEPAIPDPVLLVEILSPTNQLETWTNVWAYTTIPTVLEVLVVRTAAIGAQLLRRNADGTWPEIPLSVDDGDLVLNSIEFRVRLADLYAGTWLAAGA